MHGVTRATILALAFLAASIPVETAHTSCRGAEISSGLIAVISSLTPCL